MVRMALVYAPPRLRNRLSRAQVEGAAAHPTNARLTAYYSKAPGWSARGYRLLERRAAVHPAAPEHRRDHLHLGQLVRRNGHGVAVEHDQVGQEAGDELAAPALVAREPGRRHGGG